MTTMVSIVARCFTIVMLMSHVGAYYMSRYGYDMQQLYNSYDTIAAHYGDYGYGYGYSVYGYYNTPNAYYTYNPANHPRGYYNIVVPVYGGDRKLLNMQGVYNDNSNDYSDGSYEETETPNDDTANNGNAYSPSRNESPITPHTNNPLPPSTSKKNGGVSNNVKWFNYLYTIVVLGVFMVNVM